MSKPQQEHAERPGLAAMALKAMKDFVSGKSANEKEKDRLKPPAGMTGVRG